MRHQAIGKLALMLGVFLLAAAASAEASPVRYDEVFALASVVAQSGRPSVDLRFRPISQQQQSRTSSLQQTASGGGSQERKTSAAPPVVAPDAAPSPSAPAAPNVSLTGTEVAPPQTGQQTNVETIELGEIQGTICDCGDILIPGGGFPKWPLLALGAIPLFFINNDCEQGPCLDFTPTPTPTPQIPEPATIFLLGTGLLAAGAGARRRRSARQSETEGAGEV